jgi:hypothetical protein
MLRGAAEMFRVQLKLLLCRLKMFHLQLKLFLFHRRMLRFHDQLIRQHQDQHVLTLRNRTASRTTTVTIDAVAPHSPSSRAISPLPLPRREAASALRD